MTACYTRFRATARWLLPLHVDDFVGIDPTAPLPTPATSPPSPPSPPPDATTTTTTVAPDGAAAGAGTGVVRGLPALLAAYERAQPRRLAAVQLTVYGHVPCGAEPSHSTDTDSAASADGKPPPHYHHQTASSLLGRWLGRLSAATAADTNEGNSPIESGGAAVGARGDEENTPDSPRLGSYLRNVGRLLVADDPDQSSTAAGDGRVGGYLRPQGRLSVHGDPLLPSDAPSVLPAALGRSERPRGVLVVRTDLVVLAAGDRLVLVEDAAVTGPSSSGSSISIRGTNRVTSTATAAGPSFGTTNATAHTPTRLRGAARRRLQGPPPPMPPFIAGAGGPSFYRRPLAPAPGGSPKDGEYVVAAVPPGLAAVMHYRVEPLADVTTPADTAAGSADSSCGRVDAGLRPYDVADFAVAVSPTALAPPHPPPSAPAAPTLHTTPLPTLCEAPRRPHGPSMRRGGFVGHEELLADRFGRAMRGRVPEGLGPDEADDDDE